MTNAFMAQKVSFNFELSQFSYEAIVVSQFPENVN